MIELLPNIFFHFALRIVLVELHHFYDFLWMLLLLLLRYPTSVQHILPIFRETLMRKTVSFAGKPHHPSARNPT